MVMVVCNGDVKMLKGSMEVSRDACCGGVNLYWYVHSDGLGRSLNVFVGHFEIIIKYFSIHIS